MPVDNTCRIYAEYPAEPCFNHLNTYRLENACYKIAISALTQHIRVTTCGTSYTDYVRL